MVLFFISPVTKGIDECVHMLSGHLIYSFVKFLHKSFTQFLIGYFPFFPINLHVIKNYLFSVKGPDL